MYCGVKAVQLQDSCLPLDGSGTSNHLIPGLVSIQCKNRMIFSLAQQLWMQSFQKETDM